VVAQNSAPVAHNGLALTPRPVPATPASVTRIAPELNQALPRLLKSDKNPNWDDKLNRVLQEIAWDAVVNEPLSGVSDNKGKQKGQEP